MSRREYQLRPNHPALLTTTFMAVYAIHAVLMVLSGGMPTLRVVDISIIFTAFALYVGDTLTPF